MKKIITLTMIKNEADIVETFVRYTMNFAYRMIFIDNGCTDGSIEILKKLKAEGFKLDIYCEADVFYEQYLLENKYIRKISAEHVFEYLIPLDVDEFLCSRGNLLEDLNNIADDKVSIVEWKTYVMTSEDDSKGFFLDAIKHVRSKEKVTFTKVILPYSILKEMRILVSMGHHNVENVKDDFKIQNDQIQIAHFPVRSRSQIQSKIYQGILAQLMSSYHRVVAFHWKKLLMEFQNEEFDLVAYSQSYALHKGEEINVKADIVELPFDYQWCKKNIKPRYKDLIKADVTYNLYKLAEVICLKSIIADKVEHSGLLKIIVYGTGNTAQNLFRYIGRENYEILAYVDSNAELEYSIFDGKIVIAPDKIKFFSYDKIVIASKADEEIREILLSVGVDAEKICTKYDLIEEAINDMSSLE